MEWIPPEITEILNQVKYVITIPFRRNSIGS
jgi:hypothetical protein